MAIGKVIVNGNEEWVGLIGGGYPSGGTTAMGFFVVNLSNGSILWSHTWSSGYAVPASPAIVDTDDDGFADTAYVGDLGGNMLRFTFCTNAQGSSCGTGNWQGGFLFNAQSGGRPIYTAATAARDSSSVWVFWGTGDKENPTSTSGQDLFFAVKDIDRTTTYSTGNLQNISGSGTIYNGTSSGWFITLAGTGEKVLSDPTVFAGIIMFTTYIPAPSGTASSASVGTSNFYAMAMMNLTISGITYAAGAGVLSPGSPASTTGGARSVSLGTGMAKSPVASQEPAGTGGTDLYLSLSGGASRNTNITTAAQLGPSPFNTRLTQTAPSTQVIHWRDGRIQ